jgi:hypothetical protein
MKKSLVKKVLAATGGIVGISGLFIGPINETGCMNYRGYRVLSDGIRLVIFDRKTYELSGNFEIDKLKVGNYYRATIKKYFFGLGPERMIYASNIGCGQENNEQNNNIIRMIE